MFLKFKIKRKLKRLIKKAKLPLDKTNTHYNKIEEIISEIKFKLKKHGEFKINYSIHSESKKVYFNKKDFFYILYFVKPLNHSETRAVKIKTEFYPDTEFGIPFYFIFPKKNEEFTEMKEDIENEIINIFKDYHLTFKVVENKVDFYKESDN